VASGEPRKFFVHARIDTATVETWVEAGWLHPPRDGNRFSEVDLARAQFIRDLNDMGVNDEAIPVILDLIDQLHGVRRTLREVLAACAAPGQSPDQASHQASDQDAPERGA
jgi:chaperone modulatory protein CbpM